MRLLEALPVRRLGTDEWQQPDRVVASLGIESDDRVADVGAGGGYFTFRLSQAVGPRVRCRLAAAFLEKRNFMIFAPR